MSKSQRLLVGDKLMDSVIYVLAVLVLGQLVSDRISPLPMVLGLSLYFWGWSVSISLTKEDRRGVKRRVRS